MPVESAGECGGIALLVEGVGEWLCFQKVYGMAVLAVKGGDYLGMALLAESAGEWLCLQKMV